MRSHWAIGDSPLLICRPPAISRSGHTIDPCASLSTAKSTTTSNCAGNFDRSGTSSARECDTEVLVEAWREWGTGCFTRFVGFWAIALYDANRRAVLLSRDRIGKAPLYVARHGGTLYFASEIAAILTATGRGAFAVREQAVAEFMAHSLARCWPPDVLRGDHQFSERGVCLGQARWRLPGSRPSGGFQSGDGPSGRSAFQTPPMSFAGRWMTRCGCGCGRMCRWVLS